MANNQGAGCRLSRPGPPSRGLRVSAEAACEIPHKALPRRRPAQLREASPRGTPGARSPAPAGKPAIRSPLAYPMVPRPVTRPRAVAGRPWLGQAGSRSVEDFGVHVNVGPLTPTRPPATAGQVHVGGCGLSGEAACLTSVRRPGGFGPPFDPAEEVPCRDGLPPDQDDRDGVCLEGPRPAAEPHAAYEPCRAGFGLG